MIEQRHKSAGQALSQHAIAARSNQSIDKQGMAQLYDAGPRAALDLGDVPDDASDATTEEDPQTVEAFVRRMRKESRQLGDVFLADDEAENSRRRSTASDLPETKETMPVEWARSVLADFSDLRLALEAHSAAGVGSKNGSRMPVPRLKDSRGWHRFCFGDTEACPESSDDEESEMPSSTTAAVQRLPPQLLRDAGLAVRPNAPIGARAAPAPTKETVETPQGTLPSVRLLLQFDFVMTQRLVAMHVRWLDSCALSHNRALWLYALLARLHKPLHRDTCAVLRQLVKRLLALRDSCEEPAALNALLALAGRYFDQASPDEIGSF